MSRIAILTAIASLAGLSACASEQPPAPYFAAQTDPPVLEGAQAAVEFDVVRTPPPRPRVEVVPPPVAGRVWVPGYWSWGGPRGYVWVAGRHTVVPRGTVWVAPRYVYRGGYHYYYRPRWVRRW